MKDYYQIVYLQNNIFSWKNVEYVKYIISYMRAAL